MQVQEWRRIVLQRAHDNIVRENVLLILRQQSKAHARADGVEVGWALSISMAETKVTPCSAAIRWITFRSVGAEWGAGLTRGTEASLATGIRLSPGLAGDEPADRYQRLAKYHLSDDLRVVDVISGKKGHIELVALRPSDHVRVGKGKKRGPHLRKLLTQDGQ